MPIAAAFTWAAERARAGQGPALIELCRMRMCGHAHHDDMLYLGKDPQPSWEYPPLTDQGYADRELYAYWAARDPIPTYAARLEADGVIAADELERFKREAEALVERAGARGRSMRHGPTPATAGVGVLANEPPRVARRSARPGAARTAVDVDPALPPRRGRRRRSIRKGSTFLEAVMLGVGDALRADPRVFVYGEDVGGTLRQRLPAAAAAAEGVRRSHHQLAARRGRGARRLRRRGAGRPAADRRDAVQRLRRDRLQSARQQRREDPLSLGRRRADGGAHAVGRPAPRRPVPQPEHRGRGSIARRG